MSKNKLNCFVALLCLVSFSNGECAEPKPQGFSEARKLEELEGSDLFRLGVGFTSYGTFSRFGEKPSLSILFDINSVHSIQTFFGVGSVRKAFEFGAGAMYRGTIAGDRFLGCHLGALFNMGFGNTLTIQTGPVIGVHMALFRFPQLQLSLDGGTLFLFNKPTGPDLKVGFIGPSGGLSIHYFF
jgi:hypothetical protein